MPFCEPDLGNALTAVAVYDARRLCSRYPLAMGGGDNVLKATLDGDIPLALNWLQGKAECQRRALDGLNRKVLGLNFALRLMNRLREPVEVAEWQEARQAVADEALRERIDRNARHGMTG